MKRTLTVIGSHSFLGHQPGESFDRPDDAMERRMTENAITAGVVAYDDDVEPTMTCPACAERMKRPPKIAAPGDLAGHYADRHPGLVVPDWTED